MKQAPATCDLDQFRSYLYLLACAHLGDRGKLEASDIVQRAESLLRQAGNAEYHDAWLNLARLLVDPGLVGTPRPEETRAAAVKYLEGAVREDVRRIVAERFGLTN